MKKNQIWVVEVLSENRWLPTSGWWHSREEARIAAKGISAFAKTRVAAYVSA